MNTNTIAGGIAAAAFAVTLLTIHLTQPVGFRTQETKDLSREAVKMNVGMTVFVSALMGAVVGGAFLAYKKFEKPRVQFGGAFYSF